MLHVHVYTCTSYAMLSSGLPSTGISHGSPYTCITDCKPSQMRLVRYSLENHKRALHNYFTMTVIENTMYCGQCNQCDTHAAHVCLFCFVLFCFVLGYKCRLHMKGRLDVMRSNIKMYACTFYCENCA